VDFLDQHPHSGECGDGHSQAITVTTMKRTLRHLMLGGWLLLLATGWLVPPSASAQDAAPKSVVVTTSTSNYILEYGMVILMFGAALFAVCRSSRRNV
jgi:hypothetical protein